MGFRDLIAAGVALADSLTADLQPIVKHEAWVGVDRYGKDEYAAPLDLPALVELKQKMIRTPAGSEVLSSHSITFLRPLDHNGAAGRNEPIDPRDKITLADGTTGPILNVEGFQDPNTGSSYFTQVWLAGS